MAEAIEARKAHTDGPAVWPWKIYDACGIWFWVVVFALVFSRLSPYFLNYRNFSNIFRQASIFAIMATGMTLVVISGGIDLSVGSVVSFTSAVLGVVWRDTENIYLALAAAMAVGIVTGIANGLLAGYCRMPPFIATFGLMSAGAGFAFALTPSSIGDFPAWFEKLGNDRIRILSHAVPVPVIIMFAVAVVFMLFLDARRFGLRIFAVGGNENGARMAGVNVPKLKLAIYTINGALASFAGIILCSRIRSSYPGIGLDMEMDVIASSVIGGASLVGGEGRIFGAVGGAVFICMIQNILNLMGVYPFMQKIVTGVFIVLAVFMNEFRSRRA
ncbi:MAG: ABC transporter permease [Planctomycetota bacterium]|nr:ABC transporter permease [Planctomycetota bacterium]